MRRGRVACVVASGGGARDQFDSCAGLTCTRVPSCGVLPAVTRKYAMFNHISIMIFVRNARVCCRAYTPISSARVLVRLPHSTQVGFGFLMTFLKRFGYTALGLNFVLSCCAFLWNVLVSGCSLCESVARHDG